MANGFQAFTQDGTNFFQIDSTGNMPNYQLRTKITQLLSSGQFPVYTVAGGTQYFSAGCITTFNFAAINPLVAFECTGFCTPLTWVKNGNVFSVTVVAPSPCFVTIYVFDQNDWGIAASNYGMQVFNDAGVLMADVLTAFARPVGFLQGNVKYAYGSVGWQTDSGTWNVAQGTWNTATRVKCAFACVQPAFSIGSTHGGQSNAGCYMSTFFTSGTVFQAAMQSFGDNTNYNNYTGFAQNLNWQVLILDTSFL